MNAITYSQIQELVLKLPATKLPLVYNMLVDLTKKETEELSPQLNFMLLPLNERRQAMAQQAKQMIAHYDREEAERRMEIPHGARSLPGAQRRVRKDKEGVFVISTAFPSGEISEGNSH